MVHILKIKKDKNKIKYKIKKQGHTAFYMVEWTDYCYTELFFLLE